MDGEVPLPGRKAPPGGGNGGAEPYPGGKPSRDRLRLPGGARRARRAGRFRCPDHPKNGDQGPGHRHCRVPGKARHRWLPRFLDRRIAYHEKDAVRAPSILCEEYPDRGWSI